LAICHPLSPLSRSSTGKAKKIIAWIWLISFMSALPWALFTKVNYLVYNGKIVEESAWCSIPFNEETTGSLYMMLASTVIYFFVPMVVVTLLYTR
jgi:neuromedin U receptor 1